MKEKTGGGRGGVAEVIAQSGEAGECCVAGSGEQPEFRQGPA